MQERLVLSDRVVIKRFNVEVTFSESAKLSKVEQALVKASIINHWHHILVRNEVMMAECLTAGAKAALANLIPDTSQADISAAERDYRDAQQVVGALFTDEALHTALMDFVDEVFGDVVEGVDITRRDAN